MRRRSSEKQEAAKPESVGPVGADRSSSMLVEQLEQSLETRILETPAVERLVEADRKQSAPEPEEKKPAKADELEMPYGFERIITHQFQVLDGTELETEYLFLRSQLSFEERASAKSYGELVDALDKAEENTQRAAELHARAAAAFAEFESDARIILGALRDHAKNALELRKAVLFKAEGLKGKAISNEDIEAEVAASYPDEWAELEKRRTRAKLSVKLMGDLKEQLSGRAWDLRTMVGRSRQVE